MDDLRARFARFERIEEPDLWKEAVARAAELEATPARPAIPRLVLVAIALLVALAGAIAIGSWLNRPAPDDLNLNVDNGLVVGQYECDLLAYDPATGETESLVPSPPGCTDAESPPAQMAWSDDGRYLAYVVARMCGACFEDFPQEVLDAGGPWLYDNATGTARQLEPCPERYCESLDISPDGSLVAYTANSGSGPARHALIVVGTDPGSSSRRIELPGRPGRPRFSPDGTQIAIPLDAAGSSSLYAVDLSVTDPVPSLLVGPANIGNPVWSPDGEWIAYEHLDSPEAGIWLVRPDGSEAHALATAPDSLALPAWSPDGDTIAYILTSSSGLSSYIGFQLWTVGVDGRDQTMVYEAPCCVWSARGPTWSPDGEYIAFGIAAEGSTDSGVATIRPDGSDLIFVTSDHFEPSWQPLPRSPSD